MGFHLTPLEDSIVLDSYKKGNITILTSNGSPVAHILEANQPELDKLINFVNKADVQIRTMKERETLNHTEYKALQKQVSLLEDQLKLQER